MLTTTILVAGMSRMASGAADVVAWGDTRFGQAAVWGWNDSGQTSIPSGLSNVVAIAAGGNQSLALTAEGRVVAWGGNSGGQTEVPAGLSKPGATSPWYGG